MNKKRTKTSSVIHHSILIVTSIIFLMPFIWLVSSSLKLEKSLFQFPPTFIPKQDLIVIEGDLEFSQDIFSFDFKSAIAEENKNLKGRRVRHRNRGQVLQELDITLNDGSTLRLERWYIAKLKTNRLVANGGDFIPRSMTQSLLKDEEIKFSSAKGTILCVNKDFPLTINNASMITTRRFNPVWSNYIDVFHEVPLFARFIFNSFYLVFLNLVGVVLSSTLVAYSFARLKWKGREILFVLVLSTMMLPMQVTMIPQFLIYRELGWVNTLKPLWVFSWFGYALYIFLLREFFKTLPVQLEEAAKIDGAGYFRTYWQIMLPQIKPALITVAVWQFLATWNDFMGPLIYIIDATEKMPLSLGLQQFQAVRANRDFALLMAGSTMMTLPVIILFLVSQRHLVKGMTLAGVTK